MYESKKIMLARNDSTHGLVGKYVTRSNTLMIAWQLSGKALARPVVSMTKTQQRITPVAIAAEHPGAALADAGSYWNKRSQSNSTASNARDIQ